MKIANKEDRLSCMIKELLGKVSYAVVDRRSTNLTWFRSEQMEKGPVFYPGAICMDSLYENS